MRRNRMTMIIRSVHLPVEVKVDNTLSAAVNLTAAQTQQTGLIINTNTNINLTISANNNTGDDNNDIDNNNDMLRNEGEVDEDVLVDDEENNDNYTDLGKIKPGCSQQNLKQNIFAINEIHPDDQEKYHTHTSSDKRDDSDDNEDDDEEYSNDDNDDKIYSEEERQTEKGFFPAQIPDVGVENLGEVNASGNKGITIYITYDRIKKVTSHKLDVNITIENLRIITGQLFEILQNKKEIIFLWKTEADHWRPIRDNDDLTAVVIAKISEEDHTLKLYLEVITKAPGLHISYLKGKTEYNSPINHRTNIERALNRIHLIIMEYKNRKYYFHLDQWHTDYETLIERARTLYEDLEGIGFHFEWNDEKGSGAPMIRNRIDLYRALRETDDSYMIIYLKLITWKFKEDHPGSGIKQYIDAHIDASSEEDNKVAIRLDYKGYTQRWHRGAEKYSMKLLSNGIPIITKNHRSNLLTDGINYRLQWTDLNPSKETHILTSDADLKEVIRRMRNYNKEIYIQVIDGKMEENTISTLTQIVDIIEKGGIYTTSEIPLHSKRDTGRNTLVDVPPENIRQLDLIQWIMERKGEREEIEVKVYVGHGRDRKLTRAWIPRPAAYVTEGTGVGSGGPSSSKFSSSSGIGYDSNMGKSGGSQPGAISGMKKALTEYENDNRRGPKIVSIEGNIGAGKSTLIRALKDRYIQGKDCIIVILEEPVEVWNTVEEDGETLLEKFYKDPVKYGFTVQTMIYTTVYNQIINAIKEFPKAEVIVCERSLQSSKFVFSEMLHHQGKMNLAEGLVYNMLYDDPRTESALSKGMLYLKTEPETCLERIRVRNRSGEENITLDYLRLCHSYHSDMFHLTDIKPETINGNNEGTEMNLTMNISSAMTFIEKHRKVRSMEDPNSNSHKKRRMLGSFNTPTETAANSTQSPRNNLLGPSVIGDNLLL